MFIDDDFEESKYLFSEILPRLWQGGTGEDDQLHSSKFFSTANSHNAFTAVVTLDLRTQPMGYGVKELRFGFEDGPIDKASIPSILEIADWAYSQWKSGENVLVRCQAGANRSGLVMALVLMKEGMAAETAIELIRSKRPHALSNSAFVKWLNEI